MLSAKNGTVIPGPASATGWRTELSWKKKARCPAINEKARTKKRCKPMMTERAYERARDQKEPSQIQAMISLQILYSPFKREQTKSSQEKKSKTN
jgi:hypothetical protein